MNTAKNIASPAKLTPGTRAGRRAGPATRRTSRSAGFSLLEVLIALVILSVGLLGIAGLLSGTMKSNSSAYMRTQATVLAYSVIDRMRSNLPAVQNTTYDVSMPAAPATSGSSACDTTACASPALAAYDISQWEQELAESLPGGRGSITTNVSPGATTVTVTVLWDDGRANVALGAPGATTLRLAVSAAL